MASILHKPNLISPKSTIKMNLRVSLIIFLVPFITLFHSIASSAYSFTGMEIGDTEEMKPELFSDILREEAVARLNELGKVSDADGHLERTFLSPASKRAINLVRSWMEDAGLRTWVDQMGNVHGRAEGMSSQAEALLIGSHLDTVIDAGIFDGPLGIVCAVSAMKVLKISGKLGNLKRPIEVIAFSDEEGVRFQSTFLGSAAIAGTRPASALQISDKSGVTVQDVLKQNSFDATEESYLQLKYDPRSVWGYVEVHIEQGPVLESLGLPLGVVKGIAGQTRLKAFLCCGLQDVRPVEVPGMGSLRLVGKSTRPSTHYIAISFMVECGTLVKCFKRRILLKGKATVLTVTVRGSQGHAGTVPMSMRQDPMTAAAELIVLLESICKHPENFVSYDGHCSGFAAESLAESLVCTVGEISSWPGASNVIPGQVTFTVDLRTMDDMAREAIIFELSNRMYQTCERRSVSCIIERKHDAEAVMCDTGLSSELKSAANSALKRIAGEIQVEVPMLMSGAGHDAMAMSHLTKVGMLFVRCRGGISHSPGEHVLDDDVWVAGLAILAFLETNL